MEIGWAILDDHEGQRLNLFVDSDRRKVVGMAHAHPSAGPPSAKPSLDDLAKQQVHRVSVRISGHHPPYRCTLTQPRWTSCCHYTKNSPTPANPLEEFSDATEYRTHVCNTTTDRRLDQPIKETVVSDDHRPATAVILNRPNSMRLSQLPHQPER